MNDNIVWVNEDTAPHTATSGTGASNPDSGKVFDTSIINPGEKSTPQTLKGVKEGDEVPYYCAVHPYMSSKLTVTAAKRWKLQLAQEMQVVMLPPAPQQVVVRTSAPADHCYSNYSCRCIYCWQSFL